jgi:hypothetical protein
MSLNIVVFQIRLTERLRIVFQFNGSSQMDAAIAGVRLSHLTLDLPFSNASSLILRAV